MAKKKTASNKAMEHPFKFIAEGLSVSDRDEVWEEQPVDIQEFIESPQFCNQKFDGRSGCRPKIMEIAKRLCNPKVREAILLLGKGCISGDSEVLLADGSYQTIESLWKEYGKKETFKVLHRDEEGKHIVSEAAVKYSGEKTTYEVLLDNGDSLRATSNHGFFQDKKRIELKDLNVGDSIDTVESIPELEGKELLTKSEARFLGYMVGDGHANYRSQNKSDKGELREKFCFTTGDKFIKEDFLRCLKDIDPECEPNISYHYDSGIDQKYGERPPKNHKWMIWFSSGYGKSTSGSGKRIKLTPKPLHAINVCKLIMRTPNLYGKCSGTKAVPKIIFKCTKNLIGEFLSGYWMADGEVNWKNCGSKPRKVYCDISSKSKKLIDGVVQLLKRLGIYAKRKKSTKFVKAIGRDYTGYSCGFMSRLYLELFYKHVPIISYKEKNLKEQLDITPKYRKFPRNGSSNIKSITKYKKEPVYDITINCGTRKIRNYVVSCWYSSNSGKDYISSLILLYHIYRCLCMRSPQKYHYLAPGSSLYFVNVARNENQAKNVFFAEFVGHLENCRWFQGKHEEPGSQRVNFDKNIYALSGNSQAYGWLGYNTIFWVGDEIAFFLSKDNADDEDDGVSKAEECWLSAYGSCQTRFPEHYKMIGITTPRFDDDFVMKKFHELTERMEEEGDAFTRQAATWDIHPTLTKEDFKHEFQRDARRTMRDFGAQPVGVIETFWGDPDFLIKNVCSECKQCPIYQGCFDKKGHLIATDPYMCWDYDDCTADGYKGNGEFRDWLISDPDTNYYLHFDLSKNKDKTGFSMSHVVDFIEVEMDMSEKLAKRKDNAQKGYGDVDQYFDEKDYITERALIKTDFVAWINPKSSRDPKLTKSGEIYYDGIIKQIIMPLLEQGFNIAKITMDQYQCLVGETLVLTSEGIVELKDIQIGDLVHTIHGYKAVTNKFHYKNVPLKKVETERRTELIGTGKHRIMIEDGSWKPFNELTIKDRIKVYDETLINEDMCRYVSLEPDDKQGYKKDITIPEFLSEDLAYILGMIWGDGCQELNCDKIGFSIFETEYRKIIQDVVKKLFNIEMSCSDKHFYWQSTKIGSFFRNNGFIKKPYNKDLVIPDLILISPKSVVSSFLKGLYDADGNVDKNDGTVSLSTSCEKLCMQVKYVLQMHWGIRTNKVTRYLDGSQKVFGIVGESYILRTIGDRSLFYDNVGFLFAHKSDLLLSHCDRKGRKNRERVVSVEDYGYGDVYDIEVEDVHHYIANGVISHNSHYFKQTIEDLGIECDLLSLDRTDEVPVDAKNAIVDNRVSYPWNYILCREARHLKYINGKKVDHPTGHGKDIIDGFFGSIYNADSEDNSAGLFFDVEHSSNYDD